MPSYRFIAPVTLMNAQAVSSTTTYKSSALDILTIPNAAFSISWSGTPTGSSLTIEGSLDGTNYSDLGVSITAPAGSASFVVVNMQGLAVRYVRVSYTNASGSGTMTVLGSAKH